VIAHAPRSGKKQFMICKRHPDGTYHIESVMKKQSDAVERIRDLEDAEERRLRDAEFIESTKKHPMSAEGQALLALHVPKPI
jgi:hypothetical protein